MTMLVTRHKDPPENSWTILTTQPIQRPFHLLGMNPTESRLVQEAPDFLWWMKLNFAVSQDNLDLTGLAGPESLTGVDAEEWAMLDANKMNVMGFLQMPTGGAPPSPRPEGSSIFFRVRIIAGDSNGNSLPDWWELAYNFNPYGEGTDAVDPNGDLDGDGRTNFDEFLTGTNPNVPDAPPTDPNSVIIPDSFAWIQTDLTSYRQVAHETDANYPQFERKYTKAWDTQTSGEKKDNTFLSLIPFTTDPRDTYPWLASWSSPSTASLNQKGLRRGALDSFQLSDLYYVPNGSGEWPNGNTQNANVRIYTKRKLTTNEKVKFLAVSKVSTFTNGSPWNYSFYYDIAIKEFIIPAGENPRFSNAQDIEPKYYEYPLFTGGQSAELTLVPLAIAPDDNMAGVVGDMIPSNLESAGEKHFVSPKKTVGYGGIPDPYVVFKLPGISRAAFESCLEWGAEGGEPDPVDPSKRRVSRAQTGKTVLTLRLKSATPGVPGPEIDRINVWIVWTTVTPPTVNPGVFTPNKGIDPYKFAQYETADPGYSFVFSIQPISIITASDHPKLEGESKKHVPGFNKPWPVDPTKKCDSADLKWDMSRQLNHSIKNPGLIPKESLAVIYPSAYLLYQPTQFATPIEFPQDTAEGNDDRPATESKEIDEDCNPYQAQTSNDKGLAHSLGQISSYDAPSRSVLNSWAVDGKSFSAKSIYREFARLEIWDGKRTGGRFWFRISDQVLWHHSISVNSTATGVWNNTGSSSGMNYGPP